MSRFVNADVQRVRNECQVQQRAAILSLEKAYREAAASNPEGGRMAAKLTEQERRIVGCIADAMTNAAIGAHLTISEETVKRHLSNVYDKLGMDTRAEVIVAVYRNAALYAAVPIPTMQEST